MPYKILSPDYFISHSVAFLVVLSQNIYSVKNFAVLFLRLIYEHFVSLVRFEKILLE